MKNDTRKPIDIEKLLQWALREELPKGQPVSASAYDAIVSYGRLGTRIDTSRYGGGDGLGFVPGTPHPDAEIIGQVLRTQPTGAALSELECYELIGDYAALDPLAVRAPARAVFNPLSLLIRCATLGQRMVWDIGLPHAQGLRQSNGKGIVFGQDADGDLVRLRPSANNSFRFEDRPRCHLHYVEPSIGELLEPRAEYTIWHRALGDLARALVGQLADYDALPPSASAKPWRDGEVVSTVYKSSAGAMTKLPLKPTRPTALTPFESEIERTARASRHRRRQGGTQRQAI